MYQELDRQNPGVTYLAVLVRLYGSAILNLVAAIGLMILSIVLLDLGPAVLAAAFPFNIDAKILVRSVGLVMLACGYFFIFRLSYLGIQIRRCNITESSDKKSIEQEIARLSDGLKCG